MIKTIASIANFPYLTTTGQAFPDGHLIELVADPQDCTRSTLMYWDGKKAMSAPHATHSDRLYQAPEINKSILRAMRLPTKAARFGSTRDLFETVAGLFKQHVEVTEENASLLSYFALSTWFVDFLPSATPLSICGRDVHRALDLLRVLSCVCRRSLMLAEITPAGFRSLPMHLRPTLLINQPRLTPRMAALLDMSGHRGLYVPVSSGDVLDLYGSKAIYLGADTDDRSGSGDAVQISLTPAPQNAAALDDASLSQIARELQPQLLMYRMVNWQKVQASHFNIPTLTFPMRQIAGNLGSCIADDLELGHRLRSLLEAQDEDVRAQRCTDIRYVIPEVILILLHKGELNAVRVDEITGHANTLLRSRGEIVEYSPAEVGWKMRNLGLYGHRDAGGKSLRLDRRTSRIAHQLGRAHGVLLKGDHSNCLDCASAQPIGQ